MWLKKTDRSYFFIFFIFLSLNLDFKTGEFEPVIDLQKSNTHHSVPSWENAAHKSGILFFSTFAVHNIQSLSIFILHTGACPRLEQEVMFTPNKSAVHHRTVKQRLTPIHTSKLHQFI